MDRKSALVAAALALVAGAATAQSITFTPAGGMVPFSQLFNPDGGVFTAGQFMQGQEGTFMAGANGQFSVTYLGQESVFVDGIRFSIGGSQLTETNAIGATIIGNMTAGTPLAFTFFGSDGASVTNGVIPPDMNPSFALLGTNVVTNRGTFQYIVGYNDSANHDDWDDFVVGINVAPIPEPQTYALLLAGLGVVGFVARRRQAR